MRTHVKQLVCLSAFALLLFSLFSIPAQAAGAQAPVWNKGDSWAMGKSVDLDQEFAEQLNNLSAQLGQLTGTVNRFSIQAAASA